ncbi:exodeoxyribonuclease VII small subunit [candidate division KSB1 bacterium]|nr:exodeoxyribonuclease VII small subunit [candidate division KSB1 bacterium]
MPKQKFEAAMQRLEEIVEEMEQGELSLEESLKIFDEGMELSRFCYDKLNQAEQQLKRIVKKDEGFQLELI